MFGLKRRKPFLQRGIEQSRWSSVMRIFELAERQLSKQTVTDTDLLWWSDATLLMQLPSEQLPLTREVGVFVGGTGISVFAGAPNTQKIVAWDYAKCSDILVSADMTTVQCVSIEDDGTQYMKVTGGPVLGTAAVLRWHIATHSSDDSLQFLRELKAKHEAARPSEYR
jgi:hypothetical protein